MRYRVSDAASGRTLAALAGLAGVTSMAAVAQDVPMGLIALAASAATVGLGVARLRRPHASRHRRRYERRHQRLAGPRPGARLG